MTNFFLAKSLLGQGHHWISVWPRPKKCILSLSLPLVMELGWKLQIKGVTSINLALKWVGEFIENVNKNLVSMSLVEREIEIEKCNRFFKQFGWWRWAEGLIPTMPILVHSNFLHKNDKKLYYISNSKWSKKLTGPYLASLMLLVLSKWPTAPWGPK